MEETLRAARSGRPSSHVPIRAERLTPDSHALPLGRNETVQPALPAVPQRTTDHPEQPVERSNQDSQTSHEDGDARVDNEPFHHEAHGASASVTTTRKPVLRAYTARPIEWAGERNTVAKTHFQSDLSNLVGWCVVVSHLHAISHNVNAALLQRAPNLLDLLLIHTTNANTTVNLTITVLNNFELKRDTVQTKNDLPAQ